MSLKWETGNFKKDFNKNAFAGGKDTDGSLIYVGRALYNGAYLPAKVLPKKKACYVSHNGSEISVENFDVLIDDKSLTWEPSSDGKVPAGAVSTGKDGNDEMFIGRAPFQSSITVGKINPTQRCLYLPFNGKEEKVAHYEVLVQKKAKHRWVATTPKTIVHKDAIIGGRDSDGSIIYVGRSEHNGSVVPCKIIPSKRYAFISDEGMEISKSNFEILIGGDFNWIKEKNGKLPPKVFEAGCCTRGGEVLYIGRVEHNKSTTVGKVHPSHGCLYIPYGGEEMQFKDYEVLTGN